MTTPTQKLSDAGVSIWLDDLSRERLETGNLQELVETRNVVGVTTNPSIFSKALSEAADYDELIDQAVAELEADETLTDFEREMMYQNVLEDAAEMTEDTAHRMKKTHR